MCNSLIRISNIPFCVRYIGNAVETERDILMIDGRKRFFLGGRQYHQWLRSCYNHIHNLCWDPSVAIHDIEQSILLPSLVVPSFVPTRITDKLSGRNLIYYPFIGSSLKIPKFIQEPRASIHLVLK